MAAPVRGVVPLRVCLAMAAAARAPGLRAQPGLPAGELSPEVGERAISILESLHID
jgi:hypothetical protein